MARASEREVPSVTRRFFATTSRVSPSPPFIVSFAEVVSNLPLAPSMKTRGVLKIFLELVIGDAITYTEHAKRKTVTVMHGRRLRSQKTRSHSVRFRLLKFCWYRRRQTETSRFLAGVTGLRFWFWIIALTLDGVRSGVSLATDYESVEFCSNLPSMFGDCMVRSGVIVVHAWSFRRTISV